MPPCQNLGFCLAPNVCNCPDGFEGPQCQYAKSKPCLDKPPTPMNSRVVCNEKECISTCNRGFTFPGGGKKLTMVCDAGNWVQRQQPPGKFQKVPDCQRNYIICLIIVHLANDLFVCFLTYFFYDLVLTFHNSTFSFPQPSATRPVPTEADVYPTICASVPKSFVGRSAIIVSPFDSILCRLVVWLSSSWDTKQLSLSPVVIASRFSCGLIEIFTAVENCSPERMNFNGGYNCSGGSASFSCSLNCGADGVFEFPPAVIYTCDYAKAKFVPESIPQCIFGKSCYNDP